MKQLLISKGANLWEAGDKARVYLNSNLINKMLGLKVATYNSGNISSATLNGESISNGYAKALIEATDKVYYDVKLEKFVVQISWGSPDTRKRAQNIENEFNELAIDEVAQRLE